MQCGATQLGTFEVGAGGLRRRGGEEEDIYSFICVMFSQELDTVHEFRISTISKLRKNWRMRFGGVANH